jgi:hypothetical protein
VQLRLTKISWAQRRSVTNAGVTLHFTLQECSPQDYLFKTLGSPSGHVKQALEAGREEETGFKAAKVQPICVLQKWFVRRPIGSLTHSSYHESTLIPVQSTSDLYELETAVWLTEGILRQF